MKKTLLATIMFALFFVPLETPYAQANTAAGTAQLFSLDVPSSRSTDNRAKHLRAYLAQFSNERTIELSETVDHIIKEADTYKIDWKLIVAIAGVESTFCKHIPNSSYNCWGWGIPTGATSGLGFNNYEEAVSTISKGLRENYINRGHDTLPEMGRVYAASPAWASKVEFFMNKIDSFSPIESEALDLTL